MLRNTALIDDREAAPTPKLQQESIKKHLDCPESTSKPTREAASSLQKGSVVPPIAQEQPLQVRPLYSQTRLSRLPRKTLSPPSSQSKPTPNTQHTTRDAAPNPQKSKRNPTDRPKATFASAPTMQPNPAQSSPTRDSLATFATVVCQSRLPEAASENAPETNKMPQKPTLPQKRTSETPEANKDDRPESPPTAIKK
jgi:hypothetical protein